MESRLTAENEERKDGTRGFMRKKWQIVIVKSRRVNRPGKCNGIER